jgi:hypothetical protein
MVKMSLNAVPTADRDFKAVNLNFKKIQSDTLQLSYICEICRLAFNSFLYNIHP